MLLGESHRGRLLEKLEVGFFGMGVAGDAGIVDGGGTGDMGPAQARVFSGEEEGLGGGEGEEVRAMGRDGEVWGRRDRGERMGSHRSSAVRMVGFMDILSLQKFRFFLV